MSREKERWGRKIIGRERVSAEIPLYIGRQEMKGSKLNKTKKILSEDLFHASIYEMSVQWDRKRNKERTRTNCPEERTQGRRTNLP